MLFQKGLLVAGGIATALWTIATAYDTSGFGNNGTFNGANYWEALGDDVLTFERP